MNLKNYLEENIEEVREEFPLLKHWVFLNAADQMIPGNYWLKAVQEFYEFQKAGRMEDIPVQDIATHPFLTQTFFECCERAARFIHADKEEVILIYRPMQVANLIINDLLEWKEGDNVVFSDLEYPSFTFILLGIKERFGVELRRVKNVNGEVLISDLERAIDEKTKLVVINRTTAFDGFTYDVKKVCQIAHAKGALVLDDAMQALGAIDVDVHEDNVDFLVSGSYKWLCGPEGAGIFYIRKDLIERFNPKFRNYLAMDSPRGIPFSFPDHDNLEDWKYPLVKTAYRFSQDTVIGPAVFGFNATLKFYEKLGIQNIEKRVRRLGKYLVEKLQEIGCKVRTPTDPKKMHGLIVYTTGSYETDVASFNRFNAPPVGQKPVKVSLRALGGVGGIRVSTHFFNTEEDIDFLVNVQKEILKKRSKSS